MGVAAVPPSTGPLARLAELIVRAQGTATPGAEVRVSVAVRVRSTGPRMLTTPATSALLVVGDDRVVSRRDGRSRTGAIPLILQAGAVTPAQAVPDSVALTAGDGEDPLPPGRYSLVAVLGYGTDSLNTRADGGLTPPTGARDFVLVSKRVPLEVR